MIKRTGYTSLDLSLYMTEERAMIGWIDFGTDECARVKRTSSIGKASSQSDKSKLANVIN